MGKNRSNPQRTERNEEVVREGKRFTRGGETRTTEGKHTKQAKSGGMPR